MNGINVLTVEAQEHQGNASTSSSHQEDNVQNEEDIRTVTPVSKKPKVDMKPGWLRHTMPICSFSMEECDYDDFEDYPMYGLSVSISEDGSEVEISDGDKVERGKGENDNVDDENQAKNR